MSVNSVTFLKLHANAAVDTSESLHISAQSSKPSIQRAVTPTQLRYGVDELHHLHSQAHGNRPAVNYRRKEWSAPLKAMGDKDYNQPIVLDAKDDELFIADTLSICCLAVPN